MKRNLVLPVAVVAILLTMPIVRADMNLPVPEVGDNWVYDVDVSMEGVNFTGEWTFEIKGEATVSGYEVYDISVEGSGTSSMEQYGIQDLDYTLDGFQYSRKSDFATVLMNMSFDMKVLGVTIIEMTMEMTYDPPLDEFDFPIKEGDVWSSTSTVTTTTTVEYLGIITTTTEETLTMDYECHLRETVTVTAGSFVNSYRIKETMPDGSYSYIYMSTQAGYVVKAEMFNSTGGSIGGMELKSYSYTPGDGGEGAVAGFDIMDYLWLIILIIVIVAVIVGVAAGVSRAKKKKMPPPEEAPPPEPGAPEPPPPPPE